ncbi:MAG: DUF4405 domain-containing protein [Patescibacteria group bacterium]
MLTPKIRAVVSTALLASFLALIVSSAGLEFGSYQAWGEPHKTIGWIFIGLIFLHFVLSLRIYFAEVRSLFRRKINS